MIDETRRAYATMGLPLGASAAQVRRRYRLLVKRWHPDRFASDAAGQSEATDRLTHINEAYRVLASTTGSTGTQTTASAYGATARQATGSSSSRDSPPRRLSREQIDGMVQAIGSQSPVDTLIGHFEWLFLPSRGVRWQDLSRTDVVLIVAILGILIAIRTRYGYWTAYGVLMGLAIIGVAVDQRAKRRRG